MIDSIKEWPETLVLAGALVFALILYFVTKKIVLKILIHFIKNNKYNFDDIMLEKKVFSRASQIIPVLGIHFIATFMTTYGETIQKILGIYMVIVVVSVIDALLNAVESIYNRHIVSKAKPIKGYLQVVKIFVYIMAAIVIVSNLIGRSPIYLLSGIGAMTAVIMLVFQNAILGLVAGIQLTANDMLRIGDWIEMPKYNADGDVREIALTTVKIENFDRTITTIPTQALINDSFKNWRGMAQSGGRRIKRSVHIDIKTVKFCTDEMLERYKKIDYISEYIQEKNKEIEAYNQKLGTDTTLKINGRHLTNIGVFRAYVQKYLENHPRVHKEMIVMARQLAAEEKGLPIEIYCFTDDIVWAHYEMIQADIFDHLISVVSMFDLALYQDPTEWVIKK
ncbi:mechanosensitive ion channel family protein [Fusibacter tunisiensis]|uniref:Miniconductance mechanosensitive channel n=1 Tax=Fusibacter tunisiensis TaxID=1008308 RepID=A0ABS2MMR3_9FIRM|nr:mechanosensitive ion channel domain-containing protein [Fusibacter tunisiensis]MBM7560674.1 miniconductance mechanosensitive channel [Fusibacter tunisiensis]